MFDLFKNNSEKSSVPEWLPVLVETEQRWFLFLDKLEATMDELCTAAILELKEIAESNNEEILLKLKSGIKGQLEHIRKRAFDTYTTKVNNVIDGYASSTSAVHAHYEIIRKYRESCVSRYYKQFDKKVDKWYKQIEDVSKINLEKEYQEILDDYERIKNKFTCKQCGSPLTIEKIFFISAYITCPSCNTQNTFEPSSQARKLEHLAHGLAQQRTAHLLKACTEHPEQLQELYAQKHQLEKSLIRETDKNIIAEKKAQIEEITKEQKALGNSSLVLYQDYLRAMVDEWNKINPDLTAEHEKYLNSFFND